MFQQTPREIAENKLILLYILSRLDTPLTNNQLTKIVLENSLMNYFTFQNHLNELADGQMIHSYDDNGRTLYAIGSEGLKMLELFPDTIPHGIKNIIDSNFKKIKSQLNAETSVTADFTPESETEYVVNCRISEGNFPLLDMKITVGTREDAHNICSNWKTSAQEIYLYLIRTLSQEKGHQSPTL